MLVLHKLIIYLLHFVIMNNTLEHILFHHLSNLIIRTSTSTSIIYLVWISWVLPLSILNLVPHFLTLNILSITERKLISLNRWMFSLNLNFLHSFVLARWTSFSNNHILGSSLFYWFLTPILISLLVLHLNSVLLLLACQYLLNFIHFFSRIIMVD